MSPEKWEDELRHEQEGLSYFIKLLAKFDELMEEGIDEYGEDMDNRLVMLLEAIRYDVNLTLSGVVKLEDGTKIPGLIKQYDDVDDECTVLQAGKEVRRGINDEDLPEDDSG